MMDAFNGIWVVDKSHIWIFPKIGTTDTNKMNETYWHKLDKRAKGEKMFWDEGRNSRWDRVRHRRILFRDFVSKVILRLPRN